MSTKLSAEPQKHISRASQISILYHSNCQDGFSAAWAAWKKFKDKADYIPVEHQLPPPELKDKVIYLLDFCYPIAAIKALAKNNKQIIIIDHHATTEKTVEEFKRLNIPTITTILDMSHSGSALAWQYFHPKTKIPKIIQHVEDSDLWLFKKPKTKEITMVLSMVPFTFKDWSLFAKKLETQKTCKQIIEKGSNLTDYENSLVQRVASKAVSVEFEGHKVSAVNSPIFISEIGHELVKRDPPFGIIWYKDGNKIKVSLRGNGSIDLTKIAEKYGGGGHKNAAGFKLKSNQKIPWKTLD